MLVNFRVNNFKGIEKEAAISSIASNKIKRNVNNCSYIDDKNKLLKKICIIGCNGSGKTSLLSAINTLQRYISFPYRRLNSEEQKKDLESMNEKELKKYILEINTLKLGEQNINRQLEPTEIELELFSPDRGDNISGFYKYKIIYDCEHTKNGVLLEELLYKKNIDSKKYITLSSKNNILESNITTTVLYENNNINLNNKEFIDYYKTFVREILDYTDCFFDGGAIDIRKILEENKNEFTKLCNIADDKIINVTIDENSEERNILFWVNNKNYLYFSQLSEGTRKIIVLGSILLESLKNNSISFIDEIELSLHHSLVKFLVDLISIRDKNNYSQIIFTTHSPLLSFSLANDELYFIHNHNNEYFCSNVSNAIKNKLLTKDQNVQKAWFDNILIKNPDKNKIENFFEESH